MFSRCVLSSLYSLLLCENIYFFLIIEGLECQIRLKRVSLKTKGTIIPIDLFCMFKRAIQIQCCHALYTYTQYQPIQFVIYLTYLIHLIYLIYLIHLIHLIYLIHLNCLICVISRKWIILVQIATLTKVKNNRSGLGAGLQPVILKFLDVTLVYYYMNEIFTASIVARGIIGFVPTIPFMSCVQELLARAGRTIKIFMTIF